MAQVHRVALIRMLYAEVIRSTGEALRYSKDWQGRNNALALIHGDGSTELRIAKRDDQQLKDAMAAYTWHRDNASFASGVISLLMSQELGRVLGSTYDHV